MKRPAFTHPDIAAARMVLDAAAHRCATARVALATAKDAYQEAAGRLHETVNRVHREGLPPCVLGMGCYCACHAAGLIATEPCDTSEDRARKIANRRHRVRQRMPRTTDG